MGHVTFYGDEYRSAPSVESAKVVLLRSKNGGTDIYINGEKVPAAMDFSIRAIHPFPSIRIEILMDDLTWEPGTLPECLDDIQDGRKEADK